MRKFAFILLATLTFSLSVSAFTASHTARAISASEWRAGRIIDTNIFTNSNAMSVAEIQTFLNSRMGTGGYDSVPGSCDTNGTRNAAPYNSSVSRASYAASIGKPTKWTCLNDYYEVPKLTPGPGIPANNYGSSTIPSGAKSAAQLIWDAAQTYDISPLVLLVTIQKESAGPLTTDDWPWQSQYTYAMGAHCPDSGPGGSANCDPNYSGFSIQISESAALMRYYLDNMSAPWWPYKKVGNNAIQYHPNTNCGNSTVFVENSATAALYTYTPYQPNTAALNNMYGTGDGCSAYGNRNFWRIFNDWFGPSTSLLGGITMTNITQPDSTPARGQTLTYSYSLTNTLTTAVTLNAVGVVGRAGSLTGPNRDFGWQGPVTLQPGATQQFTFTTIVRDTGMLYVWPAANYQGSYVHYNNWGAALNAHSADLVLTSPLTSSITNPVSGQTATLSATIKNNEDQPINLSYLGIPARYFDVYNYDLAWTAVSGAVLQPNATQAVTGTLTFDKPGPYKAWLSGLLGNQFTTLSPTLSFNATKATPTFALTYIETPNQNPALGEDIVVKFKLKNNSGVPMTLNAVGVVGRYDNPYTGANNDFGWAGPESFTVGEEKSYTAFVSNVSDVRNFYAWVAINYQGTYIHYNNWGFMMSPHLPNLTVSVPLSINNGVTPTIGQTVNATATIKNNETKPIRYGALGIPGRYYGIYNYDTGWQGPGTLAPGDTVALSGTIRFDKTGPYTIWTSTYINGRFMTIGNPVNINL